MDHFNLSDCSFRVTFRLAFVVRFKKMLMWKQGERRLIDLTL